MYNVRHSEGGQVTITEVGDHEPLYTLGSDTFITFNLPDNGYLEIKQVKDFGSDAELLEAIVHKVSLPG